MTHHPSRRQFLKTSTALTAGAALASGLTISQSAHAAGSDEIKIALIAAGGRGAGALRDRVQVGDNVKVVAVADAFLSTAQPAAVAIRREAQEDENPMYGKVDLPDDRVFGGLDSYKKAIDCLNPGDQVILASPPGFRPYHYRAAIEKGLHVFMEKPVCIDAPGFRHFMETNRMADEKNLKVCVGYCFRYDARYANWVDQIHAGRIGDLQYTRGYYNTNGIWCRNRNPGEGELEFQTRNWYHFVWLCGENIVEQHCHRIDVCNWVHSKGDHMAHPIEANAMGGRLVRSGPEELLRQAPDFANRREWDEWYRQYHNAFIRHGQAWDSFMVEYAYGDGTRHFSQCRHIRNTWNHNEDYVHGTQGTGTPGTLLDTARETIWAHRRADNFPKGMYQWEHDVHVKAIRENTPMNDGYFSAMSSMMAVLGREAAYSGRSIKWDELVANGRSYFPDGEITSFDQKPPVQPDANGFYESSVPVPGVYNPFTEPA
ncbi:MAG: Gfo/Idh/MocA family oxidoreductase [Planctomycetaceae bacterium]|nr:Gfo/Idh/MocA family oxidoreductase [Planctomycetaceae bacterium]